MLKAVLGSFLSIYAVRVIPELGGAVVGFDLTDGGFVKSGVTTGLKYCGGADRDFSGVGV